MCWHSESLDFVTRIHTILFITATVVSNQLNGYRKKAMRRLLISTFAHSMFICTVTIDELICCRLMDTIKLLLNYRNLLFQVFRPWRYRLLYFVTGIVIFFIDPFRIGNNCFPVPAFAKRPLSTDRSVKWIPMHDFYSTNISPHFIVVLTTNTWVVFTNGKYSCWRVTPREPWTPTQNDWLNSDQLEDNRTVRLVHKRFSLRWQNWN